jgi:hypothetical protein
MLVFESFIGLCRKIQGCYLVDVFSGGLEESRVLDFNSSSFLSVDDDVLGGSLLKLIWKC